MSNTVPKDIIINVVECDDDVICRSNVPTTCPPRPTSVPTPSNAEQLEVRKETTKRFSAVLNDIEARTTEGEERKLHDLLSTMKQVKSNTLFGMIVVTIGLHLGLYIADIITDMINGIHYLESGKIEIKK